MHIYVFSWLRLEGQRARLLAEIYAELVEEQKKKLLIKLLKSRNLVIHLAFMWPISNIFTVFNIHRFFSLIQIEWKIELRDIWVRILCPWSLDLSSSLFCIDGHIRKLTNSEIQCFSITEFWYPLPIFSYLLPSSHAVLKLLEFPEKKTFSLENTITVLDDSWDAICSFKNIPFQAI